MLYLVYLYGYLLPVLQVCGGARLSGIAPLSMSQPQYLDILEAILVVELDDSG